MNQWIEQVRQLLAKAKPPAPWTSGAGAGLDAANDGDSGYSAEPRGLSRVDRSLLVMDVVRIAAERGCDQEVARELKRLSVPSVAHLQDEDLIELFIYLDHELASPEQRWSAI